MNLMDRENILKGKKYLIKIKKNIPQKAGLGGGSMNAATLIRYFLPKKDFTIRALELSDNIGSDVKFGLNLKTSILLKNQSIKRLNKKFVLYMVIVKPNFGCSTRLIYKKVKNYSKPFLNIKFVKNINIKKIKLLRNDLERVAKKEYPRIEKLLNYMINLEHNEFVRMTGSGSAIIAYFKTKNASLNAAKVIKKKYKNYWCILSKTI